MTKADDKIKAQIAAPRRPKRPFKPSDCLSTGSTLLNLACTGRPDGGFPAGYYIYFVGDTDSGKTFFCLTCLAEAVHNPKFKDHRFIYDGGEFGALMDMEKFFGRAVVDRLEPPARYDDETPAFSQTIEEFYFNLLEALNYERPCIYILDSMDALSSNYEGKKFKEREREFRGGATAKGDFGDGKAKYSSANLRQMIPALHETGSILIIINQTRDNPAAGMFESKKTHAGGYALQFYATIYLWSSVRSTIKQDIRGKKWPIGTKVTIDVKRSRVTGRKCSVVVPIYPTVGIDDLGSCVDFLADHGHWKRNKEEVITAQEFDISELAPELIRHIEQNDLELNLRKIVTDFWREIEAKCAVERKSRYD